GAFRTLLARSEPERRRLRNVQQHPARGRRETLHVPLPSPAKRERVPLREAKRRVRAVLSAPTSPPCRELSVRGRAARQPACPPLRCAHPRLAVPSADARPLLRLSA